MGLAIADGLLALEDRVVDVLPDHVPGDVSEQGSRITVHHLLSMTAGHAKDSLAEAWDLEPGDLVKGFLRLPFGAVEGTRHTYDNSTTFILARMVERVTGRGLPEYLDERLFGPMGIDHAEWDRVVSGATFGFHGLHLTTEAVAAFGELLLRAGAWGDRQLVPRDWVELATRRHVDCVPFKDDGSDDADFSCGYGYQFWMSRHGYHGHGSFGQLCVVIPSHDLVIAVTAQTEAQEVLDAVWECLLPGLDGAASAQDDILDLLLAERMRRLSLPTVPGSSGPKRSVSARLDARAEGSALPDGTTVIVDPVDGGWLTRFDPLFEVEVEGEGEGEFGAEFRAEVEVEVEIEVGHGHWRESSPLGRPLVAAGAWQGGTFIADLYVITTPHRVRLVVDAEAGIASATWSTLPLTGPSLALHARAPLMTRPDVA